MNFEQLIENLTSGNSFVFTTATDQKYKSVSERIDGKETGLKVVKASGGRVTRKVAENTLLNGLQSLLVRKGFAEFGNDGLVMFADTDTATLQTDLIKFGIEPRFLSAIVSRFLKQIDIQMILTDVQSVEILKSVAIAERTTADSALRVTDENHAEALADAEKWNNAANAERANAIAVLTKTAAV